MSTIDFVKSEYKKLDDFMDSLGNRIALNDEEKNLVECIRNGIWQRETQAILEARNLQNIQPHLLHLYRHAQRHERLHRG